MADKDKIKNDVKSLIADARLSLNRLREESIIPACDFFKLSYLLGDTAETKGAAAILSKMFPEDKEVELMRIEATDIHTRAYRERDRFSNECECRKKI